MQHDDAGCFQRPRIDVAMQNVVSDVVKMNIGSRGSQFHSAEWSQCAMYCSGIIGNPGPSRRQRRMKSDLQTNSCLGRCSFQCEQGFNTLIHRITDQRFKHEIWAPPQVENLPHKRQIYHFDNRSSRRLPD